MSSSYYLLCMSHDPATIVIELRSTELLPIPREIIKDHPHCDFVIMRVSGAPVEFGCVSNAHSPCAQAHRYIKWVDADWLRILGYFEPDDPRPELQTLFKRPTIRCWSNERVHRLRHHLEL